MTPRAELRRQNCSLNSSSCSLKTLNCKLQVEGGVLRCWLGEGGQGEKEREKKGEEKGKEGGLGLGLGSNSSCIKAHVVRLLLEY